MKSNHVDSLQQVDAAAGSSNIAGNINVVAQAVPATTGALGEADASDSELTRVADELRTVVARFRVWRAGGAARITAPPAGR